MHPVAFRKAMIEAYLAGAESIIESGSKEYPSKEEARNWFDNEYGLTVTEETCDCCEEKDDE
jgi:hypothetical protein